MSSLNIHPEHKALAQYLSNIKVESVAPPLSSLIVLNDEQTIYQALQFLSQNKISAAPVLNKDGVAVGMCSVLDIVVYVLHSFDDESDDTDDSNASRNVFELMAKGSKFSREKLSDLMSHQTKIDSYVVIKEGSSLSDVLKYFSDGVHRCPIISQDDKKLKSVLTQSAIVKHISQQQDLFSDFGDLPIKDLTIGSTPVITAEMTDETLNVFKKMVKKRVAGVAIVDDSGALLGNISARDLSAIQANSMYSIMHQDARHFIQKMRAHYINIANPAIAVSESTPLKLLLLKLAGNGIHRIFVCDKEQKPIRVISLRDIIDFVWQISKKHGQPQA